MAKKSKVKKLTLRQQLRAKAEEQLKGLKEQAVERVGEIADAAGINKYELMKACSVAHHTTLEHQLVTDLANNAEAELMRIWNNQQDLPLGDDDGDK